MNKTNNRNFSLYNVDKKNENSIFCLPWLITVLLFASIYIFRMSSFGSYIVLALALIMLAILVFDKKTGFKFKFTFFHAHILLFALYSLLSSSWALEPTDSITKAVTLFEILICMSVFYSYYYRDSNGTIKLLKAVMWAGYIVMVYTFFYYGISNIFDLLYN